MTELSQEWTDRLRKLVACERWRWMIGTTWFLRKEPSFRFIVDEKSVESMNSTDHHGEYIPDPRDPATLGCLLAMLLEADDGDIEIQYQGPGDWWQITWGAGYLGENAPLWQAVVAALEVAWEIAA